MKKEKIIKLISIIVNLFIFSSTTYVVTNAMVNGYYFGDTYVPPREFSYFRYFTTLSNMYAALIALLLAIYTIITFKKDEAFPKWLSYVALGASTSVGLTFLTTATFLAPQTDLTGGNYFIMFMGDMFFMHFFTPVLSCLTYIFLLPNKKLNFKEALFGVLPMAIYACIYAPMVLSKAWPDFYNFTFGGKWWAIFIALPIMLCVTYLISWLLTLPNFRRQK